MCLVTEQNKPTILDKDLTVFKIVRNTSKYSKVVTSVIFPFRYEIGVLYQTPIVGGKFSSGKNEYYDEGASNLYRPKYTSGNLMAYSHGFHSALSEVRLSLWYDENLVRCTIPKGSQVIFDETGLCVSDQIIINKII